MIYVCSPFRAYEGHTIGQNIEEATEFCRVLVEYDEIPIAPHLLFPQFLDDYDTRQRKKALTICKRILAACDSIYVYQGPDGYISEGMQEEIHFADRNNMDIVRIPENDSLRGKFRKSKYFKQILTLIDMHTTTSDKRQADALAKAVEALKHYEQ